MAKFTATSRGLDRFALAIVISAAVASLVSAAAPDTHLVAQRKPRARASNPQPLTPNAQSLAPIPDFADPSAMFQRFFGPAGKEDQAQLEAVEVSPAEEEHFGRTAADAYLADQRRGGFKVLTKANEVEYLRDLVEILHPLLRNADRYERIHVYLVDSETTDARSFPGGFLVFHRGMLDFAESEAALVGVVGHELSHLDHGHQLAQVKRMKLAERTFAGQTGKPPAFEDFMQAGRQMMSIWARPFSPEDESQADQDGAKWAHKAGYDPRELAALFAKMQRRAAGKAPAGIEFFRTHPSPEDRQQAVLKLAHQLRREKPREALYVGKENLRRRVSRAKQEFPE
ncbi:MAG: M48 family metalloprotease [Planctomycetia bacterium]|nr:M48 family metalloprotease [Planctomycetia bacterium]